MANTENPFGVLALTKLLEEKGGEWKMGLTPENNSAIDITLPDHDNPPFELTCDICGDKMRLIKWIDEHSFERAGIIIRFHDVVSYVCDRCNIQNSPEDTLQRKIMGQSLQVIIRQLAVHDLTVKRASFDEVESAIS